MTIYEIMQDAMKDEVTYQVEDFIDSYLVELNNDYCSSNGYYDDEIFDNDAYFFQDQYGDDVYQAVEDTQGSDYDINESYVKRTIYGLETSDSPENLIDDMDALCDYALENEYYALNWDDVKDAGKNALYDAIKELSWVTERELEDVFQDFCLEDDERTLDEALEQFKEQYEEDVIQETVENQLDTLGTLDRIALWNDYQNDIGDSEYIFDNNVETFASCEVFESQAEIWLTLKNSPDYKFNDYYMVFEDGRTLVSSNNIDDLIAWDTEKIAKWVIENEYWEYADYLKDPKEM